MTTDSDEKLDEAKKNICNAYTAILEVLKLESEKTNYSDRYIEKLHDAATKLNSIKQQLA